MEKVIDPETGREINPNQMPEFSELSPMQKFVIGFMQSRAIQTTKLSGKKMTSFYIQVARFDHLRTYLAGQFTGAGLMKKSEMLDFMIFLLEGFVKREYGNYKSFDEYYNEQVELEAKKESNKESNGGN